MLDRSAIAISARIETEISNGQLRPGDRLVSVRDLASDLGVSPTTVSAAYRRLRERGVVVGRGRQGTSVAPRVEVGTLLNATVPTGLIDALTGGPDPTLLPSLAGALEALIGRPQARYGDIMIDETLAEVARRLFASEGVDASHLAVTSGAMDAIERIFTAHDFRPGDRIGVEDPGHIPVHQLARSAGLELVALPVDDEGITVPGLLKALKRGLSAIVVTPRAQNPTGATFTRERAAALSGALAAHPEVFVIQDDHAGPVAGADYISIASPGPHWATIRSLGKSLGPDLRLALVAADVQTADRVSIAVSNGPGWISHLLQRTAGFLLADPATSQVVETAARSYRDRRRRLITMLAEMGVTAFGASGLNVWIPTNDEQAAVEAARLAGYAIRAGDPYRIVSPSAVRVTITNLTDDDIDKVASALTANRLGRRHAQLL